MAAGAAKAKSPGSDEGLRPAKPWVPWALLLPGLAWLFVFFVIPLFQLGRGSLKRKGLTNYSDVFSKNGDVIGRTFLYAIIVTVAAVLIGYPLAYFIAMKSGRWKPILLAGVVLPFFVTYLIRTLAWKVLLFSDGPVAGMMRSVGLLSDRGEILNTHAAVLGALLYNFLPFMILPIFVSLDKIDRRLLEAGPDLYANGPTTFRKVTLPLSLPGVFAGSLLTFIPACGDFINAELLGSDRQRMIGNLIEKNFLKPALRPQMSALSFVLMLLILGGVLLYARILGTEELA
jgi:spermidine/putrescine transport system permease protein